MVLLLVAIAIGALIAFVLLVKYFKTNPRAVLGASKRCRSCGMEISGTCPRCSKRSFGV